jgi:asparagine synthase (glutamine-hydrolysing)
MCGIAGHLSWSGPSDSDLVSRMTACVAHRGPDGSGVATIGPLTMGHRRLAVIDLSTAASQPMHDITEQFWIVFNGEIYNYRALRCELAGLGARFHSQSDTEVILEAYKQWGVGCLARLNGMFAFALWDATQDALLLARDRLGEKPLYYRAGPDGVVFASELKALCADRRFRRVLSPRALSHYLSLNYTLTDAPILEGVSKLRPGHFAVCRRGLDLRQQPFWDLAAAFSRPTNCKSIDEAAEALRALIDDAVKLRLVSDVPLGVFLSGGLDSSTLAAAMCQAVPATDVKSFSMGFREASFSEVAEAKETAAFLGIDHRSTVTTAHVAELLPAIVCHADEPFADTSVIPMYLLSAFARQHVTVCLTGDGGDELFAGYETYVADKLHRLLRWSPPALSAPAARAVRALLPVSFDRVSLDYKIRQFVGGLSMSTGRAHYHWRTIFSSQEKRELLQPEVWRVVSPHDAYTVFEQFERDVAGCDDLGRASYVDIKTWLADDILVKADRASMAHGLELRAPFLDYRVVEFAASLPSEWKIRGTKKKRVLKRSQQRRVPPQVLSRKKQGFNAPVAHWLLSSFREAFEPLTVSDQPAPIFNPETVRRLWREHAAGHADHGHKLLGLINLQLWLRQFPAELA